ncbi:sulfur oxidation c-type cytochrome SoxX [Sulfurihydrogenibium azorense]|uniref:Monoheme cytochrome SoxX n=1 Tax=Sulfurihydrogenibium azorense (strain DSM 15241 / OCM 825 / Az-Fu1) TaxID=204536 RepID=C1DX01_SULAA|nr:sulfur oxidation c-type cytochrome SoxX [Sulfurihydrogenibium azorense]ACN99776.1 monoheme cytochrome SoxX [Sulfurihydrogenibium azorense Az-Fu1]
MKLKKVILTTVATITGISALAFALTLQDAGIENPEAKSIMLKDVPPEPRLYAIDSSCNLSDKESIKKLAEKGKKVFMEVSKGNCVACHCAPEAKGCGNIGPDLTGYKNGLFKAPDYRGEPKTVDWLHQKIADGRILIPKELQSVPYYNIMTVQLTTGQLTAEEVCQLTAYILSLE